MVETSVKKAGIGTAILQVLMLIIIIWIIEIINHSLGYQLSNYGILPRTSHGLMGILLAPLIHNGVGHTLMNTIPLFILGILVSIKNHHSMIKLSLLIVLIGGFAVWLFGRSAYHVGASGLIFGFFGFLLARGWYVRDISSVLISVITLFLYGGMIFGVLPLHGYISWESHLFGFLAGIVAARIISNPHK
jgi:membrane associated rhomboid family serine protease